MENKKTVERKTIFEIAHPVTGVGRVDLRSIWTREEVVTEADEEATDGTGSDTGPCCHFRKVS